MLTYVLVLCISVFFWYRRSWLTTVSLILLSDPFVVVFVLLFVRIPRVWWYLRDKYAIFYILCSDFGSTDLMWLDGHMDTQPCNKQTVHVVVYRRSLKSK
jgi:hypothetical protein